MKQLLVLHTSDAFPDIEDNDPSGFSHRQAARAIVTNRQGQVALLNVTKHGYHKLPGGGVEAGEDMMLALQRELVEEIGCKAEVTGEVGKIIEYRDKWTMKQTSHCYLATQIGEQSSPAFTEEELNDGFEVVWADTIDEAIALLESDMPTDYQGKFIQRRDSKFLETAKALR